MKYFRPTLILFTLVFSLTSCGQQQQTPEKTAEAPEIKTIFENISVQEFRNMPTDTNVVILDVRTDEEVARGAIDNSIQINFYSPDFKEQIAKLDPDKKYVVYCKAGGRSAQASRIMSEELGFKEVKNLEGGYDAYSSEN